MRTKRISKKKSKKNVYRKKFNRSKSRRKNTKRKIRNRRNRKMKGGTDYITRMREEEYGAKGTLIVQNTDLKDNKIPDYFFNNGEIGYMDLKEVTLKEDLEVQEIGKNAFRSCVHLVKADILANVDSIGDYAFSETGLTKIVIPESCKNIGNFAFYNCKSLTSITFQLPSDPPGEGQTKLNIGARAFMDCFKLKNGEIIFQQKGNIKMELTKPDTDTDQFAFVKKEGGFKLSDFIDIKSLGTEKAIFTGCFGNNTFLIYETLNEETKP